MTLFSKNQKILHFRPEGRCSGCSGLFRAAGMRGIVPEGPCPVQGYFVLFFSSAMH